MHFNRADELKFERLKLNKMEQLFAGLDWSGWINNFLNHIFKKKVKKNFDIKKLKN